MTWGARLRLRGSVVGGLVAPLVACSSTAPAWRNAAADEWPAFQRALAEERQAQPRAPWAAGIRVVLRAPGRTIAGRGGLAAFPGKALRMIVVSGPGATVLDIWVTRERWRIAVPPLGRVLRGGRDEPPDLPVGFLRWWFCTPLDGTLFAAARTDNGATLFALRDGNATVELRDAPRLLVASRRVGEKTQIIRQQREGPLPRAGDAVHYESGGGVTVDLVLESLAESPPSPAAFVDPDTFVDAP